MHTLPSSSAFSLQFHEVLESGDVMSATPPTRPKEVVIAMYEALSRSDQATLQRLTDPQVSIHVPEILPYGGTYVGWSGLQQLLQATSELMDSRIEWDKFLDSGDQVVAVGFAHGRGRKSGRSFDAAIVHVLTVRDGRITGFQAFVESAPVVAALRDT
ncbi:hypothetical protein BM536_029545 [Streptomyces phaeoluteigriseus]|uniref:SnoaL-like domain-containing protein n=2 Tax=Streptomyces phaeoluteigriseus TaxID=114686 RepID=A0A1V6MJ89_9ACTN|nr:hypothetical protein BM536_029545 [Streptomyces phaeoluteigriseus]